MEKEVEGVKHSKISRPKIDKHMEKEVFTKELEHIEKEEELEVEALISKRIGRNGKPEYLVKWKNYDRIEYNTWEMADGLEGSEDIIQKFENDLVGKNKSKVNIKKEPDTEPDRKMQIVNTDTQPILEHLDKRKETVNQQHKSGTSTEKTECVNSNSKSRRKRKESILEKEGHRVSRSLGAEVLNSCRYH